jgi:hypothetical protein
VGFAPAQAGDQIRAGVFGLDAVAEPVRAPRRARLIAQRLGEPGGMLALGVGVGGVASGDLLGQDVRARTAFAQEAHPGFRLSGVSRNPSRALCVAYGDGLRPLPTEPGRESPEWQLSR